MRRAHSSATRLGDKKIERRGENAKLCGSFNVPGSAKKESTPADHAAAKAATDAQLPAQLAALLSCLHNAAVTGGLGRFVLLLLLSTGRFLNKSIFQDANFHCRLLKMYISICMFRVRRCILLHY